MQLTKREVLTEESFRIDVDVGLCLSDVFLLLLCTHASDSTLVALKTPELELEFHLLFPQLHAVGLEYLTLYVVSSDKR